MTNRRLTLPELSLLLIAIFIVRRAIGGPPVLRSEFVVEDFIVLLVLALCLAPSRFKPLLELVVPFSMSVTLTVAAWAIGSRTFPLVVLTPCAIYGAARTLIELTNLRKRANPEAIRTDE
jgi:hypothetical protein